LKDQWDSQDKAFGGKRPIVTPGTVAATVRNRERNKKTEKKKKKKKKRENKKKKKGGKVQLKGCARTSLLKKKKNHSPPSRHPGGAHDMKPYPSTPVKPFARSVVLVEKKKKRGRGSRWPTESGLDPKPIANNGTKRKEIRQSLHIGKKIQQQGLPHVRSRNGATNHEARE